MRYLLIILTFLLFFTGCQEKSHSDQEVQAKQDAKIAQQAREELLAELEVKKQQELKQQKTQRQAINTPIKQTADIKEELSMRVQNTKLNPIGIHVEKNSITIDTNKTKAFFEELSQKMSLQMKKISDDFKQGVIDTKEAGIEINKQHINIDLNKTQNMLDDWGKKIKSFIHEIDDISESLEQNNTY